ncbi:MAG: TIR domain-containing protein, partial [Acidobacteria bacterium]|nr:TIR domain-containing protein [Acidobacteriota bacterium]
MSRESGRRKQFLFDVFLSYSSKDKAVVRALAERLRGDGLRVWLDEWTGRPDEEGLEQSRVMVLCLSANAFGADWARLEAGSFRFRDPNGERRFVPLRLDGAQIPESLGQFLYVDLSEYPKLVEACRYEEAPLRVEMRAEKILSLGHTNSVSSVAWSPDGKRALSGSWDNTVLVWDVEAGSCERVLEGHTDSVFSVAWSGDGKRALSGSDD